MGGSGSKGGGGSSGSISVASNPYQQTLADISSNLYSSTQPLRSTFIEDWMNFLRPSQYTSAGTSYSSPASTTAIPMTNYSGAGQLVYNAPTSTPKSNEPGVPVTSNAPSYGSPILVAKDEFGMPIYGVGGNLWNPGTITSETGLTSYDSNNLKPYAGDPTKLNYQSGYSWIPQAAQQAAGTTTATTGTGGTITTAKRYDPSILPGYAPIYELSRTGLEDQYNVAKENILANTPRGGAMANALKNLEESRAQSVGSLQSQISSSLIQDIMNKAYGAAWNSPSTSISGLSSAASSYQSALNTALSAQTSANAQANASKSSGLMGLGSGIGWLGGSLLA